MVTHSDFLAWRIPALELHSYPQSALSPQMRHANLSVTWYCTFQGSLAGLAQRRAGAWSLPPSRAKTAQMDAFPPRFWQNHSFLLLT